MITELTKIKNLGLVFTDYQWQSGLAPFRACNLFYGWNGSGKTTLTRLFDAIGGISAPDLEYEIKDEGGNLHNHSTHFPRKVRVFNHDYIETNITLLEGRTKTISIVLGGENKDLMEVIKKDRELLGNASIPGKVGAKKQTEELIAKQTKERSEKFTEVAKLIGAAVGGNALRVYRRPDAEKDFNALKAKAVLSDLELELCSSAAKQDPLPAIDTVKFSEVVLEGDSLVGISDILTRVSERGRSLLKKTVESEVITRLASSSDIAGWVETGLALHQKHSTETCEYCLQPIPKARTEQLMRHFNAADKTLKSEIDSVVETLQLIYARFTEMKVPDKMRFYSELQEQSETDSANFATSKKKLLEELKGFTEELKAKKAKTTEEIVPVNEIVSKDIVEQISNLNRLIETHNKKTASFTDAQKTAIQKLKNHYLSLIYDDVAKYEAELKRLGAVFNTLEEEIAALKKRIAENLAKVSSQHKACAEITEKLTGFLGHSELSFAPHISKRKDDSGAEIEEVIGYRIMRGERAATRLSEGEKTAIAFVYFAVHLGDENFDLSDGIVVIDDPISSLDSNSLYQAFSFLKNTVKDAKQVFIFTHNFEFLKLLLNWRNNVERGKTTGFYMIKNSCLADGARHASIHAMDKELHKYESEYHFLFKKLKELRAAMDDSIERSYPIPNIARKVWDTFLTFRVPNGGSQYSKSEALKSEGYDAQILDAIYKFTNDNSHITGAGFNPALVPETKRVVGQLIEMMKKTAPEHFSVLDNATN